MKKGLCLMLLLLLVGCSRRYHNVEYNDCVNHLSGAIILKSKGYDSSVILVDSKGALLSIPGDMPLEASLYTRNIGDTIVVRP